MTQTFMPLTTYFSFVNHTIPILIDKNFYYIFGYKLEKIHVNKVMPFKELYFGLPKDSKDPNYVTNT